MEKMPWLSIRPGGSQKGISAPRDVFQELKEASLERQSPLKQVESRGEARGQERYWKKYGEKEIRGKEIGTRLS
jgi:hypothetical protein